MVNIDNARISGKHLKTVLDLMVSEIKPGNTGKDLEKIMISYCKKNNLEASFKGFMGYPSYICVCINEEIVHGIPDEREFKEGDIVSVDAGITYKGAITDSARTVVIGMNNEAESLLNATQEALDAAISVVKGGVMVGEISSAIENVILSYGYHVLSEFCGHGVGNSLHSDPQIPNDTAGGFSKEILKNGDIVAIEPITSLVRTGVAMKEDGWTYFTLNKTLSCQCEYTVLVKDHGCEVLT